MPRSYERRAGAAFYDACHLLHSSHVTALKRATSSMPAASGRSAVVHAASTYGGAAGGRTSATSCFTPVTHPLLLALQVPSGRPAGIMSRCVCRASMPSAVALSGSAPVAMVAMSVARPDADTEFVTCLLYTSDA